MENKKITTNSLDKIVKQIKKEHFIKLGLWTITGIFLFFFLFLLLFSVIPFGNGETKSGIHIITDIKGNKFEVEFFPDPNGLYVFNANNGYVILLLDIVGMSGWLTFLVFLSITKNMITPSAIKGSVRKGLQYNYLKQEQVDRIVEEIDINIGVKQNVKED